MSMRKTLLLADDSVTIQRVVELTFSHEDVRVVSLADGKRAAQWITAERPDIVLADVSVPELDGYGILAHVKKSPALKHIPVLLLAGAFEAVDEARARAAGCDGILLKPFEPKQLVARVRELLSDGARKTAAAGGRSGDRRAAKGGSEATKPVAIESPAAPVPMEPPAFNLGAAALEPTGTGGARPDVVSHQPPAFAAVSEPRHIMSVPFVPEPLEPPTAPLWEVNSSTRAPSPQRAHAPVDAKVSLASAFSALLAAEQSQPAANATAAPQVSDAAVEAVVRRVLTRMTDQAVRQIVSDTAERLVREEIDKIKSTPE
jgi:DNA-binding response OmpR family regulator